MKQMHVTLVGSHPLPGKPGQGGVQRVMEALRLGLAEEIRVSIVVPNATCDLRHVDENGEIVYLRRSSLPATLSYCSWCSRRAYQEIERLSPDLIHVHDLAGYALLWPKYNPPRQRPWVFTAHGVNDRDLMQRSGTDLARRLTAPMRASLIRTIEKLSRNRFDATIIINRYLFEAMSDLAERRHELIPNPVDDIFFSLPYDIASLDSDHNLLYVGEVSPLKNLLALVRITKEMVKQGAAVHLHIVGPIIDHFYLRECRKTIIDMGLESHITFHGPAEPRAVVRWMDHADALLLASKQETAPMVVAEAHSRGLPVAAPRAFGLINMISEGRNGVFLDGPTPAADASRITELLNARLDRAEIRSTAGSSYKLRSVVHQTLKFYHELIGLVG